MHLNETRTAAQNALNLRLVIAWGLEGRLESVRDNKNVESEMGDKRCVCKSEVKGDFPFQLHSFLTLLAFVMFSLFFFLGYLTKSALF